MLLSLSLKKIKKRATPINTRKPAAEISTQVRDDTGLFWEFIAMRLHDGAIKIKFI